MKARSKLMIVAGGLLLATAIGQVAAAVPSYRTDPAPCPKGKVRCDIHVISLHLSAGDLGFKTVNAPFLVQSQIGLAVENRVINCQPRNPLCKRAVYFQDVEDCLNWVQTSFEGKAWTTKAEATAVVPNTLRVVCAKTAQSGWEYNFKWAESDPSPTPTSCIASAVTIALAGVQGNVPNGGANASVSCTQPATVRLTIPSEGVVNVGGGGAVTLNIKGQGASANAEIDGNTDIWIGARYTGNAAPGSYTGSTVLKLDIL